MKQKNQDIKRYIYKLKDFIKFVLETIKWGEEVYYETN